MKLVVDASALVAESLRRRGRALIADERLELLATARVWDETHHELGRRMRRMIASVHAPENAMRTLFAEAFACLGDCVTVTPDAVEQALLEEAYRRVPRDPTDAPTVALALAVECGIWTADHDFFGCGVPVWVTETLSAHLAAEDRAAAEER